MADTQAKVILGVDGVDEVVEAARKVERAWSDVGKTVSDKTGKAVEAVAKGFTDLGRTVLHVATAMQAIDLGRAVEQTRQFGESLARMSVASGESVGKLGGQFEALSKRILVGEPQLQALAQSLGKVTYDFSSAIQAQRALGEEATATGRSADEMQRLGATLHNALGISGDLTDSLGRIRAQAETLGTVGGVAALHDQLAGLGETLTQFSHGTDEARNKLTALVATMGKGKLPGEAQRIQSSVLGMLSSQSIDVSRTVGYDILDESGHVKDPTKVLQDLQASMRRRGLKGSQQLRSWRRLLGNEAGSWMHSADLSQVGALAGAEPSTGAAAAMDQFAQSTPGERLARQQENDRAMRKNAEVAIGAQDTWNKMFAGSPMMGLLAGGIMAGGANALLGAAPGWLGKGARGFLGLPFRGRGGDLAGAPLGAVLGAASGATPVEVVNWPPSIGGGAAGTPGAGIPAVGLPGAPALPAVGALLTGAAPLIAGFGALAVAAGAAAAVLADIGEDRDKMGKEWRAEIQPLIDAEKENTVEGQQRAAKRRQREAMGKIVGFADYEAAGRGTAAGVGARMEKFDPALYAQIDKDPVLREMLAKVSQDRVPEDMPEEFAKRLAEILRSTPMIVRLPDPDSPNATVAENPRGPAVPAPSGKRGYSRYRIKGQ